MSHVASARICAVLTALLLAMASPASAYIGPGAGLGAFAIVLALGAGLLLLIAGLVWFPLKRMLKRRKADQTEETPADTQ